VIVPARVRGVVVALVLAASSVLSLALSGPPEVVPATARATEFSAERAHEHVATIAQRPHPMGTEEHARVQGSLLSTLTGLGLTPQVERATAVTAKYRVAGAVENLVARLEGTGPSRSALLLAAHYDSVPSGPGAGDDASGVAALLETLRALRAGPPLQNDVIVLFTDGEEDGLLGASAFMAEHPWAKEVRLALNFEARGNSGPAALFETSPDNGMLVREAARAAPDLVGSSLAYEVYKRMPNDTDLTVFKSHGLAAMNFAFVGHWEAYHTPLDDAAHLDPRSLQQQGSNALALARAFGNHDLSNLRAPDAVYFALPGRLFVHYGAGVGVACVLVAAALLVFGIVRVRREGSASVGGIVLGIVFCVVSAGAIAVAGYGLATAVTRLHAGVLPEGDVVRSAPYAGAIALLLVGLWGILFDGMRIWLSDRSVALGVTAALVGLATASLLRLPGASYLLVWPALASSLLVALPGELALECALMLPAALIFVPLLAQVFQGLGVSVVGAVVEGAIVSLFAASLVSAWERMRAASRIGMPGGALAAGLALGVVAAATTRYGPEHPKPEALQYVLDADTGKASWSGDGQGSAAPVPLEPPEIDVVRETEEHGARVLDLVVRSQRHARALHLSTLRGVLEATVNGKPFPAGATGRGWDLSFANVPTEGFGLYLRIDGTGPVDLLAEDHSTGTPVPVPQRSPWTMPRHRGNETLVRRKFLL
jgi:hypothetical protein